MWTDVIDLNSFYRSDLGKVARFHIAGKVRRIWPDVTGQILLGAGYATPYLEQFEGEAERVLAVMPAHMGVTHWPIDNPMKVTLAEETNLPFPDLSIDRLLLVHAIENAEQLRMTMREAWRVLSGSGRMIIAVPSRRGLWARNDKSPFGHGKPFNQAQLTKLLRESQFEPTRMERTLYLPPTQWRSMLRTSRLWERIGSNWVYRLGGVILIEATKQIYAASLPGAEPKRRLVMLPSPISASNRIENRQKTRDEAPSA